MLTRWFEQVATITGIRLALVAMAMAGVTKECGRRNQTTSWPFHVGLYREDGGAALYFCGATVVSQWHVLGSAHCVQPHQPEVLSVRYGAYDLTQDGHTDRARVAEVIIHPDYRAPDFRNDLALLQLLDPLPLGALVQPVCLMPASNGTILRDPGGTIGTSVGWGIGPRNVYIGMLLVSDLEAPPQSRCKEVFTSNLFEDNEFFCAVTPVCSGSGGSGFYVQEAGRYYLRGITTFGIAPKGHFMCGVNTLTGLINLETHTAWVQQKIAEHSVAQSQNKVNASRDIVEDLE